MFRGVQHMAVHLDGVDPYPVPVHIVTVVNLQVIVKSSVTQSTFTVLFWAPISNITD